jgi:hypothetical protein
MVYKWYSQLQNYRVQNNTPINQLQMAFSIWSSGVPINKVLAVGKNPYKTFLLLFLQ